MSRRADMQQNEYRSVVEINQNGKYCVRIRARFARHGWVLSTYFLASSFDRAMKKLEQSLQFLQRHEDRLWFWGVDRSDDPNFSGEMLREAGLHLDRRSEFPRKAAALTVLPDRAAAAFPRSSTRLPLAGSVPAPRTGVAGD